MKLGELSGQIYELMEQRIKDGEPKYQTGQDSYSASEWKQMIERIDADINAIKEEQKERFEKLQEESVEDELNTRRDADGENSLYMRMHNDGKVPYSYLAKNGIIDYKGVIFTCDEEHSALCLGDMSDADKVIAIPLSGGGVLKVNRDSLGDLSKAIDMFSPEDINRIMRAIAQDSKIQQIRYKLEEDKNSIGHDSTNTAKDDCAVNEQPKKPLFCDTSDITEDMLHRLLKDREEKVV